MTTLKDMYEDPNGFYSLLQIAKALRITKRSVAKWCYLRLIQHEIKDGVYRIKGKWLIEYLDKQQTMGFKSVREMLQTYTLPYERK